LDEPLLLAGPLAIPWDEIDLRFSRSSGPGGQNVNRTDSRVELLFDVAHSPSLSDAQRASLSRRLAAHLDRDGVLHLWSQETPSQWRNRQEVVQRLRDLLIFGLHRPRRRVATRPTLGSRQRRLEAKRHRGAIKQNRRRFAGDD
jgi:ribosome-associated protein